jgi:hypothetical protein
MLNTIMVLFHQSCSVSSAAGVVQRLIVAVVTSADDDDGLEGRRLAQGNLQSSEASP